MCTSTADWMEKFNDGGKAPKKNPGPLDALFAKLSAAAQEPARKFRDLILSDEQDLVRIHAKSVAIKEGLANGVKEELETYKHEVARMIFLPSNTNNY
ncbi:hypothetical protein PRIPAC_96760 [Pristionchus pacificus]|uniref:Uncharacterized protein n=1 Tax=Pristionchus pacificus TaxID=54126 RepID=A0A2A6D2K0_PRIPA|nr:hypothetical protein PRIPAC_96760 [Pristionchus pacificus]|eukprot:PDM84513.1 hypothetical protein PRIPAC_33536 [Pristionchus pacificus]